MSTFPIGQRESQNLEFKGAQVLRKPLTISREAVGMLNAGGGEIWVGIREQDGVATAVEPIEDAENRRIDLLNHLMDSIEPSPVPDSLNVELVEDQKGQRVLRVIVRSAQGSSPYALLKEGGRHFLRRIDHRLRPMTREEVFRERDDEGKAAREALRARRDEELRHAGSWFWIGIQPNPLLRLDVQDRRLEAFLADPTLSGNRRAGWNFRYPLAPPELGPGCLQLGNPAHRLTRIFPYGGIDLIQSVDHLGHRLEQTNEIDPLAVLEYAVSMCRLALAVYKELVHPRPKSVLIDMAIVGASGWHLPPYAPGTYGYMMHHEAVRELPEGNYMRPDPLEAPYDDLRENPDRVGFRLVRDFYQFVGLREERIPSAYDRDRHKLELKD